MNIKQALKAKNKLTTLIKHTGQRLERYNQYEEGLTRPYDPLVLITELKAQTEELIDLKLRVTSANIPIQRKIYRLSELKALCATLRHLRCEEYWSNGRREESWSNKTQNETRVLIKPVIDLRQRDAMVQELELEIESIQEELDRFNHITTV